MARGTSTTPWPRTTGDGSRSHLRVTRRYATEVLDCYTRAVAVRYGLDEDGNWLAVFATEGVAGPYTITVLGPHRALARYTERPGFRTDPPMMAAGAPPQATVITFEDEWGDQDQVHIWLVSEDGSPLFP